MKYLLLLSLYFAQTFAFSPRRPDHHRYFTAIVTTTPSTLLLLRSSPEEKTENPCWQDVYDDDCSMNNIAAAGFVASKWIKGMPCAAGIEVSNNIIIKCQGQLQFKWFYFLQRYQLL
jgi:hypothetical protein